MQVLITEIEIPVDDITLTGNLIVPEHAESLVIFSHGSGSSRFSPRNRFVAEMLNRQNIATLLTDLLTLEEDELYESRFDIRLLADRLISITKHVRKMPQFQRFNIGYFGASTGAASALIAAAEHPEMVDAIVLRGGRPDLAPGVLHKILVPTLMIVGSLDLPVIELNRKAIEKMSCKRKMIIVAGAGHLFEEAGKLKKVSDLAAEWFVTYLLTAFGKGIERVGHEVQKSA